jgi:hypothetical protein
MDPWDHNNAFGFYGPSHTYHQGGYVQPVQQGDDVEVANIKRRRPAMETTIEVDRTDADVRVLVTIGKQVTTYKLTAELAKYLGEDLFKAGCNLEAQQGARGA